MPFTFSHPALALPLLTLSNRWRSATGLIIGSIAPDFEKFIRMSDYDPYSHTWRSILYFNLPLSLLLAFVFHLVVRNAVIQNLPEFLKQRFSRYISFDWVQYFKKHYVIVIISILIGTASHLAWDSFTHDGGIGVRLFPVLEREVLSGPFSMKLYALMQKITSVIGALALGYLIFLLPKEELRKEPREKLKFWFFVAAISLAVVAFRFLLGQEVEVGSLYHLSIVGISAGVTSLIISPGLWKLKEHVMHRRNGEHIGR